MKNFVICRYYVILPNGSTVAYNGLTNLDLMKHEKDNSVVPFMYEKGKCAPELEGFIFFVPVNRIKLI